MGSLCCVPWGKEETESSVSPLTWWDKGLEQDQGQPQGFTEAVQVTLGQVLLGSACWAEARGFCAYLPPAHFHKT